MNRGPVVALAGGVLVAAVAVGVAVLAGRSDHPAAPAGTAPPGVSGTELPPPEESYWTPERMRSARPAPMPGD